MKSLFALLLGCLPFVCLSQPNFRLTQKIDVIYAHGNLTVITVVENRGLSGLYWFEADVYNDLGGAPIKLKKLCSEEFGSIANGSDEALIFSFGAFAVPSGTYYVKISAISTSCTNCGQKPSCLFNVSSGSFENPKSFSIGSEETCTDWDISPTSKNIAAAGGEFDVEVSVTGSCEYDVDVNVDWIDIEDEDSDEFTVVVGKNNGGERNGTITVKDGDNKAIETVSIRQSAAVIEEDCAPPAKPNALASNSPQVGSVKITRTGSPPSGVVWYWQGNSCGTSKNLGSDAEFAAFSTGTYHLRAYKSAEDCWSLDCESITVTVTSPPSTTITLNSTPVIPPWQRAKDNFIVSANASTSNGSQWKIFAYNAAGSQVSSSNAFNSGQTGSFTLNFSEPAGEGAISYKIQSVGGGELESLDSHGTTNIIEEKWENENVVYYNDLNEELKIPLKYFPETTSIKFRFDRENGSSSYDDNVLWGERIQLGNKKFITLNYANSNLYTINPGVFKVEISYVGADYTESARFDLVKIGSVHGRNKSSNEVVVLVGGMVDIEDAIQALPETSNPFNIQPWSIANEFSLNYGKNTWYVSVGNVNPLQKNAFNLGKALEKIRALCLKYGAANLDISIVAHSKGGLELRMMLDGIGTSTDYPLNFDITPPQQFRFLNTLISNSIKNVFFLGTPHQGVEPNFVSEKKGPAIIPSEYVSNQLNSPSILSYFNSGTRIPDGIHITTIGAHRKCNLSDGSVSLLSSDFPNFKGSHLITRFNVKSIPLTDLDESVVRELFSNFCELDGCSYISLFVAAPPPINALSALALPCNGACILNHYVDVFNVFKEISQERTWNNVFHHTHLTSSMVLNNAQLTCTNSRIPHSDGILNKIVSVIDGKNVVECTSPLLAECPRSSFQLFSSILPNAHISQLKSDGTSRSLATSDENGLFYLYYDETLGIGDQIKIDAPGIDAINLVLDSSLIYSEKVVIPIHRKEGAVEAIQKPYFKIKEGTPISTIPNVEIEVSAENATSYAVRVNDQSAFLPLPVEENTATIALDTGLNQVSIRFIGAVDTVELSKEVYYLPMTIFDQFGYRAEIFSDSASLGSKVYVDGQFVTDIKNLNETIPLLNGTAPLTFTKIGYRDSTMTAYPGQPIQLSLEAEPPSMPGEGKILDFSNNKVIYHDHVTLLDSTGQGHVSLIRRSAFESKRLIPKSNSIELLLLDNAVPNIKLVNILDQPEALSEDRVFIVNVKNDSIYSKLYSKSGMWDYDSSVQKLSYRGINFSNGTVSKELIVLAQKQAPIARDTAFSFSENDTITVSLNKLFEDPDDLPDDMSYEVVTFPADELNVRVEGSEVVIAGGRCFSGMSTFELKATHDELSINKVYGVTIDPAPEPLVQASGPLSFCPGDSVTLSTDIGSSFLWSTGGNASSIVVYDSADYWVEVTDIYGCTKRSADTRVSLNPVPILTMNADGPTQFCQGDSVLLMADAQTPVVWSTGETSSTIKVKADGIYSVEATNDSGCKSILETEVAVFTLPVSKLVPSAPLTICEGDSVLLAVSDKAISYLWNAGKSDSVIYASIAGDYFVTITDINECSANSDTVTLVVNPNPIVPEVELKGESLFCSDNPVTLSAPEGFIYSWSNGAVLREIPVKTTGEYSVTVTDRNGCHSTSAPVSLTGLPVKPVITSEKLEICPGETAVLTSSASQFYSWSNGAQSQVINVSEPGNYFVTVTDANGCTATSDPVTVLVKEKPLVVITPGGATSICPGNRVELISTPGNKYQWSTGDTTQSVFVNRTGSYTVTTVGNNNCSATSAPISVTLLETPSAEIFSSGNTTLCSGSSVTLTAAPNASYIWSNGHTTQSISAVDPGNYSVTVIDKNGCRASNSINIQQLSSVEIKPEISKPFCGGANGSIDLSVTGGTPPYSYKWSTGANAKSIKDLAPGIYTVTITDSNSCKIVNDIKLDSIPSLQVTTDQRGITCFEKSDGQAIALVTGGQIPYEYEWSNGDKTSVAQNLGGGVYTIKVTDAKECVATDSVTFIEPSPLAAHLTFDYSTRGCTGMASANITGGVAPYSYLWDDGQKTSIAGDLCKGKQRVTVTDFNGCQVVEEIEIAPVLGVDNRDVSDDKIKIFPNPTSDSFTVEFLEAYGQDPEIYIYALDGKAMNVVKTGHPNEGNKININVSSFPSGEYIIYLRWENNWAKSKLIVGR